MSSLLRRHRFLGQLLTWCITSLVVVNVWGVALPLVAQPESSIGNRVDGYPIVLNDRMLFRLKAGIPGVASAEERANLINQRLATVADDLAIAPDQVKAAAQGNTTVVKAGDTVLFTVREDDAIAYQQSHQAIADQAVNTIQNQLRLYREERSLRRLITSVVLAGLSTILLLALLKFEERCFSRLKVRLRAARAADALNLRINNVQLLGSEASSYLLGGIAQLLKLLVIGSALYLYIPFVLKQFPATRPLGDRIFSEVARQGNVLTQGFVRYLPNLIAIVFIGLLTYFILKFAKLVITELGRDDAYSWFYPEWIQPTIRLATFLIIALACVVAAPYLPGFGSPAFQGISIFLGALLSLGASSTVANAISGSILVYTRAFQLGDMVRVGDLTGEVVESSLFVTRLLTFNQEVITIPNSSVISSHVTNYSSILRQSDGHLLLHTTVTLGYDTPWRKIHDVLIEAAKATEGILLAPPPFVLQTHLNDFNVSYALKAYTDHPTIMPVIYSRLHQNIQDYCNQAGIEILSPAYSALRDGNHSTIPGDYLAADYNAPKFQIQQRDGHS